MRLDLALVHLRRTFSSGLRVLGTLDCDEQIIVETDQPHIELSNPGRSRIIKFIIGK